MMPKRKVVVFDLDDTLYKEIDFVESAYKEIASTIGHSEILSQMMRWYSSGENVFLNLNLNCGMNTPIADYLRVYRAHKPAIVLSAGVENTLNELKSRGVTMGLITDGRSETQRNKIKSLGLNRWFDNENIIISEEFGSEKTDERNFIFFMKKYPGLEFMYIGDNPKKDFIIPNRLGWKTVMLKDDGRNIHKQEIVLAENMPQTTITSIEGFLDLFK